MGSAGIVLFVLNSDNLVQKLVAVHPLRIEGLHMWYQTPPVCCFQPCTTQRLAYIRIVGEGLPVSLGYDGTMASDDRVAPEASRGL